MSTKEEPVGKIPKALREGRRGLLYTLKREDQVVESKPRKSIQTRSVKVLNTAPVPKPLFVLDGLLSVAFYPFSPFLSTFFKQAQRK